MKKLMLLPIMLFCQAVPAEAVDSYRYLHVGVDTPWTIFLFLFGLVFIPVILAVVLHWRSAMKKDDDSDDV